MPAEARRVEILDVALPLLVAQGDKVTTNEIAAAAGIAEGTIFRVFANKDELIQAVVDRAVDPAPTEEAISRIDTTAGLEPAVTEVVRFLQRRYVEVWQLLSSVGPHYHRPGKGRDESPALLHLLEVFRDQLDATPREAAGVLRGLTIALTHDFLTPVALPPERIAHRFLRGVIGHPC